MKVFKIISSTSSGSTIEQFVVAGNDIEAKRIAEEESDYTIDKIEKIQEISVKDPCLLSERKITDAK